jgi:hypothetical protein
VAFFQVTSFPGGEPIQLDVASGDRLDVESTTVPETEKAVLVGHGRREGRDVGGGVEGRFLETRRSDYPTRFRLLVLHLIVGEMASGVKVIDHLPSESAAGLAFVTQSTPTRAWNQTVEERAPHRGREFNLR